MPEITVNHKGEMEFETKIGNHKLTIDIPPENNGKDRGPTPPQLFIAIPHHVSRYLLPVTVTMSESTRKDYLLACHTINSQTHHLWKLKSGN